MSDFGSQDIAETRSRSSWNDRLTAWERPASDNEERQIEAAATEVRAAIAESRWLRDQNVEIRPQGSYYNNTNVRLQADMDLIAWHPAIKIMHDGSVHEPTAYDVLGYESRGVTFGELNQQLRAELERELVTAFGKRWVSVGTKAFTVGAVPGSRAPIDVVPAFRFDYVGFTGFSRDQPTYERVEGIYILGTDGKERINFPTYHHDNGIEKRSRTQMRYKRVVRCLKRLRDELVSLGHVADGQIASYLIECLAYEVEDPFYLFDEDRYGRLHRVLTRSWTQLWDDAWIRSAHEVNGIKFLFRDQQPWAVDEARAFVGLSLQRLTQ